MQLTYQQAYDKIIEAYFKDEIKPMNTEFCFCGTLAGNHQWYYDSVHNEYIYEYTFQEFGRMEKALFYHFPEIRWVSIGNAYCRFDEDEVTSMIENYEEKLFLGMSAALDVLKEIHRSRGEDVDNISQPFIKRNLNAKVPS